jgi:hypothetical protein
MKWKLDRLDSPGSGRNQCQAIVNNVTKVRSCTRNLFKSICKVISLFNSYVTLGRLSFLQCSYTLTAANVLLAPCGCYSPPLINVVRFKFQTPLYYFC